MTKHRSSLLSKVWSKISIRKSDEYWLWTGATRIHRRGSPYGRISLMIRSIPHRKYKNLSPHRVVFESVCGPIPSGREVCHRCGNSLCCNPNHLYAGTHDENCQDTSTHGSLSGEHNPRSKLMASDIKEIRKLRKRGETLRDISAVFGVHLATIGLICQHKTWR